jgi:hypothetical protein
MIALDAGAERGRPADAVRAVARAVTVAFAFLLPAAGVVWLWTRLWGLAIVTMLWHLALPATKRARSTRRSTTSCVGRSG